MCTQISNYILKESPVNIAMLKQNKKTVYKARTC